MIKSINKEIRELNIKKIEVHCGIGRYKTSPEVVKYFFDQLYKITKQKPKMVFAKRPIAGFHLREKMPLGFYVTLRRRRMFIFFNRLVKDIFPHTFDFPGLKYKQFDGTGNITFPIESFFAFHECEGSAFFGYNKIGLNITIVTCFDSDEEALYHLHKKGIPLSRR
jgi:large subunit ribosomal protein L5